MLVLSRMKIVALLFGISLLVSPASATTIILKTAGAGSFVVPFDWNNAANTVEIIGGGGGGGSHAGLGYSGAGGAGGMYAKAANLALTPGTVISYSVGAGGAGASFNSNAGGSNGGDTLFGSYLLAKGGSGGQSASGSVTVSPSTSMGIGSVIYLGGNGGGASSYSGGVTGTGGGGGGAGGPNGAGLAGATAPNNGTGGNGGAADSGAVSGVGQNTAGVSGSEWGTAGSGSGGGGATWSNTGGAAGSYGGGGGGGAQTTRNQGTAGGNGAQGLIVITYTPIPTLKTVYLTTTGPGTFVVPDDWNSTSNSIEALGGGGGGGSHSGLGYSGAGGAGGMYARVANIALTPGTVINYSVGFGGSGAYFNSTYPGGNGGDTSFGSYLLAKGGPGGPSASGAVNSAPPASKGVGSVIYLGGNGGGSTSYSGGVSGTGGGGGGAGGPYGAGLAGSTSSSNTVGGNGGAGDNGVVRGVGQNANGSSGTEWGPLGTGSGGGGANWSNTGGAGGSYGGGGGGGAQTTSNQGTAGGNGAQGIIVIAYTPKTASPSTTLSNLLGSNGSLPASDTVGATAAEFGVSSSGAATYSTPIMVPVGTTGVQPKITIDYNSGGGKGPLGFGGSIGGLSVISRCGGDVFHDGIVKPINFSATDKFCLNGERLVPISGGTYGAAGTEYRTAMDEFSRIISYGSAGSGPLYFKVWKKSGEILEYGNTADSFISAGSRSEARAWALNKLSDTAGNYIKYAYFQNSSTGEYGISRIDYTGNDAQGLSPYNSVQFVYAASPKTSSGYFAGQQYTQTQRLTDVKVYVDSTLYRDYQLNYLSTNQLASIVECTASVCFEPTLFTWAAPELSSTQGGGGVSIASFNSGAGGLTSAYSGYTIAATGDFNGDGITDFLMMAADQYGRKVSNQHDYLWLGAPTGTFTVVDLGLDYIPGTYKVFATGSFGGKGNSDLYFAYAGTWGDKQSGYNDYVLLSTGGGSFNKVTIPPATGIPSRYVFEASGNFRGKGLTDLVAMKVDQYGRKDSSGGDEFVFLANGDGTFRSVDLGASNALPTGFRIGAGSDFNGDALTDIYWYYADTSGRKWTDLKSGNVSDRIWVSNGDGSFQQNIVAPASSLPNTYKIAAVADFNGDSSSDFLVFSADGYGRKADDGSGWLSPNHDYVWLGKGDGTFNSVDLGTFIGPFTKVTAVTNFGFSGLGATDLVFTPVDGSGRASTSFSGSCGSGCSWSSSGYTSFALLSNGDGTFSNAWWASDPIPVGSAVAATGDFNGDGALDLFTAQTDNYGNFGEKFPDSTTASKINFGNPIKESLITAITNGLNNKIQINYKPLTDSNVYTKYTDAVFPVVDVSSSAYVVSQIITDNGLGGTNSQSYKYSGLKEQVQGIGGLGFAKMAVTDDATGIVTESAYNQYWDQRTQGELGHSQTVTPGGVTLEEKFIYWSSSCASSDGTEATRYCFRYSPQSVTKKKDLNGADLGTITENSTYDAYGFVTSQRVDTTLGANTYTKITTNAFTHDSANWILGRLNTASVTHRAPGSPDLTRSSAFTYDPSTGLLLSETIEPGNALATTKAYVRNGFGAVTSVTESWNPDGSVVTSAGAPVSSRTTSYTYDTRIRYHLTETNPLGQSQTNVYDPVHGLVTSSTGPNGLTTSWSYDSLGLVKQESRADGTRTQSYRYACGVSITCPANAAYALVTAPDGGPVSAIYKDKLHRTLRQSTQGFDGRFINVDTIYDSQGHVLGRSEPSVEGGSQYWTQVQYDLIGRPVLTTKPDNKTESLSYNGLIVKTTNGLGQTKTVTSDVLGRMVTSTDTNNVAITYAYDSIGELARLTDPSGHVTTMSYDIRGNKVAMSDPDKGSWTYAYNPLGLLAKQIDAKGQVTWITYDALGRMLSRTDDALGVPQVSSWVYDAAAKGVGKLATSSGYGYSASLTYDALGRPSSKTEIMDDGSNYTVTTAYDAYSRPSTVAYPTGLTVQTSYTSYGQLAQLKNATSGVSYWQATSADARGNVTSASYGNGVSEQRNFDAATGYLTNITSSSAAAGTIQNLSYSFDTLGNLLSRSDQVQSVTETFQYDTLNRVVASTLTPTVGAASTISVSYDALGNVTSKSDVGSYVYGPSASCANNFAGPHAVSSVAGNKNASYCYDANGNLSSGDGRVVSWTAFNMPSLIQKDLRSIEIAYGPERARFKRVDTNETGTTTTYYVAGGSHEVVTSGSTVKHKTYIGGAAVVIETTSAPTASEIIYLLHDHLGSTDVITDASGAVQTRYSFDAWGARRDVSWAAFVNVPAALWQNGKIARGFTGHEELDEVGLVHMNGRVYDPQLGRFLSADPFVQDPSNLQALNPYSYVQNNPLSYTDPSGYFLSGLFKAIGHFFSNVWHAIVHAVKSLLSSSIFRSIIQIAACIAAPGIGCGIAAAVMTLAAGGTPLQALKAFAFAEFSQYVWTNVGQFLRGANLAGNILAKGLVHGVIGGALSVAQGGNFLQGFAANAVGAGTGLMSNSISGGDVALDTAIVGAAGGAVSVLTGGKFAAGFITASFANLFNKYAGAWARQGAVGGGLIGGALVAGGCTLSTGGACVLASPGAYAGGSLLGAGIFGTIGYEAGRVVDYVLSESSEDSSTTQAAPDAVHGNSLQSMRTTSVYELRDASTDILLKYGITSQGDPSDRYSNPFYDATNSYMNVLATFDNRADARALELGLCGSYVAANGRLPPLSSRC